MSKLPSLGPRGEGWVAIQIVLFWLVAAGGIARSGDWGGPAAIVSTLSGLALIVGGLGLAVAGIVELQRGRALTAVPHPRTEARLVDGGVYGLVRHPIYGGLVLAAAGWALTRASLPALLGAALLLGFFELKRRREETWLDARFAGYAAYRSRTRRLIPWIW